MNWLQKVAIVCQILSSGPAGVHVLIDGKEYWYVGDPPARAKLDYYCRKGWHGKAVQLLRNAFDLLETPAGIVEGI